MSSTSHLPLAVGSPGGVVEKQTKAVYINTDTDIERL